MSGRIEGDPGEANRGIGQQDVTTDQRPAARVEETKPGSGTGPTSARPRHQEPGAEPDASPSGTYGQG